MVFAQMRLKEKTEHLKRHVKELGKYFDILANLSLL